MRAISRWALMLLAWILLPGISVGSSVSMNVSGESGAMFLSQERAAIFEVKSIGPFSQTPSEFPGISIRQFEAVVNEKDALPSLSEGTDLVLLVRQGVGIEAGSLGLQDWFPTRAGATFVAAFHNSSVSNASQLVPLSLGVSPETAWQDCKTFYAAMTDKKTDKAESLAGAVRRNKSQLGQVFFQLLFAKQRSAYGNREFAGSLAEYLEAQAIDLRVRQRIVLSYLDVPEGLDSHTKGLLASATLKVISETYHSSMRDQSEPLLRRLCNLFQGSSGTVDFGLEANNANRELLGTLLKDERTVTDHAIRECLAHFKDGGH